MSVTKVCPVCAKGFEAWRRDKIYCSLKCKGRKRNQLHESKEYQRNYRQSEAVKERMRKNQRKHRQSPGGRATRIKSDAKYYRRKKLKFQMRHLKEVLIQCQTKLSETPTTTSTPMDSIG